MTTGRRSQLKGCRVADKLGDATLWIDLDRTESCVIVRIGGELDADVAGLLRQTVLAATPVDSLVIDLQDVAFIDSAGLGAVISGLRHVREAGGRAGIAGPRGPVRGLLQTTGVDRLVPVAHSPEAVLAMWSEDQESGTDPRSAA